jgi:glucan 1,3-beta-glucosidase
VGSDVGVSLIGENGKKEVGSVFFADSHINRTKVGIKIIPRSPGNIKGNTLITLDNVGLQIPPIAVQDTNGASILPGNNKYKTWTLGNVYYPDAPNGTFPSPSGSFDFMSRPPLEVLEGGPNGGFFERSKPQYETAPVSGFMDVKDFGAKGDGINDDTAAIKRALSSTAGSSILYFPAGSYIVTDTVTVRKSQTIDAW